MFSGALILRTSHSSSSPISSSAISSWTSAVLVRAGQINLLLRMVKSAFSVGGARPPWDPNLMVRRTFQLNRTLLSAVSVTVPVSSSMVSSVPGFHVASLVLSASLSFRRMV